MNKTPKQIGRPTFRIDGTRLRELRKEAGLSQLELAKQVYTLAGKEKSSGDNVMKNSVQRWEATGALPPEMAQNLAEVLKTTLATLQGARPEPAPNRVDEIEGLLKHLIAYGASPVLSDATSYYREMDSSDPVREVAEDICGRIEFAQLSQAEDEFEEIAAITGFSRKELWEPTSFLGFWLLVGTGPLAQERSEILSGVSTVLRAVREEITNFTSGIQESDVSITFSEDRHWLQVRMQHPRFLKIARVLRFVRCQPTESGLKWSSPTWRDRFMLEFMADHARVHFNIVSNFEGVQAPADFLNLRFAVTKAPGNAEQFNAMCSGAKPEVVLLTAGSLFELHPETQTAFKREGNLHYLVLNRLAEDLWDKLLPLLAEWPLDCWSLKVCDSCIDVILDVPFRLYAKSQIPMIFGRRFSVTLVELTATNETKTVPWSGKSVAEIYKRLNASLNEARQEQAVRVQQPPAT